MGRAKNFVVGLIIAAAALSGACASVGGERSISEVKTNPGKAALVPSQTPTHPRGAHATGATVPGPCRVRAGSGPIDPPSEPGLRETLRVPEQGGP